MTTLTYEGYVTWYMPNGEIKKYKNSGTNDLFKFIFSVMGRYYGDLSSLYSDGPTFIDIVNAEDASVLLQPIRIAKYVVTNVPELQLYGWLNSSNISSESSEATKIVLKSGKDHTILASVDFRDATILTNMTGNSQSELVWTMTMSNPNTSSDTNSNTDNSNETEQNNSSGGEG